MKKPTQDRSKTIRSVYDQEIIDSDNMNLSAIFFFINNYFFQSIRVTEIMLFNMSRFVEFVKIISDVISFINKRTFSYICSRIRQIVQIRLTYHALNKFYITGHLALLIDR